MHYPETSTSDVRCRAFRNLLCAAQSSCNNVIECRASDLVVRNDHLFGLLRSRGSRLYWPKDSRCRPIRMPLSRPKKGEPPFLGGNRDFRSSVKSHIHNVDWRSHNYTSSVDVSIDADSPIRLLSVGQLPQWAFYCRSVEWRPLLKLRY